MSNTNSNPLSTIGHRGHPQQQTNSSGFTLFEALIAFAIASILGVSALPPLHDLMLKQRRSAALNNLNSSIHFARSAAQARGQVITFCPSRDWISCSANWQQPGMIFVDKNNDRVRQSDEPLLKRWPAINPHDRLYWHAFRYRNALQFLPSGMTNHQNGSFVYCPDQNRTDLAHALIMTKLGRVRLSRDRNGDGFHEGADGRRLHCS